MFRTEVDDKPRPASAAIKTAAKTTTKTLTTTASFTRTTRKDLGKIRLSPTSDHPSLPQPLPIRARCFSFPRSQTILCRSSICEKRTPADRKASPIRSKADLGESSIDSASISHRVSGEGSRDKITSVTATRMFQGTDTDPLCL